MVRATAGILVLLAAIVFLPPIAADLGGYRADPARVRHDGRQIEIGDGRFLHVVDLEPKAAKGQGAAPVVLIHGLPGTTTDWAATPDRLVDLGHRVIVYDRVGYGFSSREPSPEARHTYASNAEDLAALLDALAREGPFAPPVLVGWSYGGGVVQKLVETSPERASAIVLIGSVGPALDDPASRPQPGLVDWIVASPAGVAIFDWLGSVPPLADAVVQGVLVEAFASERAVPAGFLESSRAALELPGTFTAFVAEQRQNDIGSLHPERIDLPALVLHGTEDHLVPYEVGQHLQTQLPRSKFDTVFDGSHMLPVTHPDRVAQAIHDLAQGRTLLSEPMLDPEPQPAAQPSSP
jgi:pimeloyl-ACP methyl ester carboxylesterase